MIKSLEGEIPPPDETLFNPQMLHIALFMDLQIVEIVNVRLGTL